MARRLRSASSPVRLPALRRSRRRVQLGALVLALAGAAHVLLGVFLPAPESLALHAPSADAGARTLSGWVSAVADGDTLTLLDAEQRKHKVRLAGIDAPERSQAHGEASRQALAAQLQGRPVSAQCADAPDRYGRELCKVLLDGRDMNLAQVRAGLAWHYKAYERDQSPEDRVDYARAERDARTQRVGLWRDAEPIAPWDYRKGER